MSTRKYKEDKKPDASVRVGLRKPRMVTPENNELYEVARDMFDEETGTGWHMGWINVSNFVDYIEETYGLDKLKDKR